MTKGLLILGNQKFPSEKSVYDIEQKVDQVKMIYSSIDGQWCNPGKTAYTLENDGNCFIFKDHLLKKQLRIDFCQAEALRALLKLEDTSGSTFNFFKL